MESQPFVGLGLGPFTSSVTDMTFHIWDDVRPCALLVFFENICGFNMQFLAA
jgi:hypothetical protein